MLSPGLHFLPLVSQGITRSLTDSRSFHTSESSLDKLGNWIYDWTLDQVSAKLSPRTYRLTILSHDPTMPIASFLLACPSEALFCPVDVAPYPEAFLTTTTGHACLGKGASPEARCDPGSLDILE